MYITEPDTDGGGNGYTLKVLKNGKAIEISDEVYERYVNLKGEIYYLYDYSENSFTGSLYIYKSKKPLKVADDVEYILKQ